MNVVVICPDAASISLRIFQRIEVAYIGAIAIKHPRPSIEDHFQFDVAVRWGSQSPEELPELGSRVVSLIALIHLQVGYGYDPLVSIDNAASIHLHQNGQIDMLSSNERLKEITRLDAARLLHLRRVDEPKPDCNFKACSPSRVVDTGQEAIAVKDLEDGHPNGFGTGIFGCDKQTPILLLTVASSIVAELIIVSLSIPFSELVATASNAPHWSWSAMQICWKSDALCVKRRLLKSLSFFGDGTQILW